MYNNTVGKAQVPEDGFKNRALKSGETKTTSPSESPHSQQPSTSLLHFRIDVHKHCNVSSKPRQPSMPRPDPQIRFLTLLRGALLPHFNKLVQRDQEKDHEQQLSSSQTSVLSAASEDLSSQTRDDPKQTPNSGRNSGDTHAPAGWRSHWAVRSWDADSATTLRVT